MKFSKRLFSLPVFLLAASLVFNASAMKRERGNDSPKFYPSKKIKLTDLPSLTDLPPEILCEISNYVVLGEEKHQNITDLLNFERACKHLRNIGCITNNQLTLKVDNNLVEVVEDNKLFGLLNWLSTSITKFFAHSKRLPLESLIQFLEKHSSLKIVGIDASNSKITGQQLTKLLDQDGIKNNLQSLNLGNCWCLNWDSMSLGDLQNLKALDLSLTNITGQQPQQLTLNNTPALQKLNLCGCRQINWGLVNLGNLQNLKELGLSHTNITNSQLQQLTSSTPALQSLNLEGCDRLQQLTLNTPDLQSLNLKWCEQLQQVTLNTPDLQSLDLGWCKRLQQLTLNTPALQNLNLGDCNQLQQLDLSNTPALQNLDLWWCDQLQQVTLPARLQNQALEEKYPGITFVYQE